MCARIAGLYSACREIMTARESFARAAADVRTPTSADVTAALDGRKEWRGRRSGF